MGREIAPRLRSYCHTRGSGVCVPSRHVSSGDERSHLGILTSIAQDTRTLAASSPRFHASEVRSAISSAEATSQTPSLASTRPAWSRERDTCRIDGTAESPKGFKSFPPNALEYLARTLSAGGQRSTSQVEILLELHYSLPSCLSAVEVAPSDKWFVVVAV